MGRLTSARNNGGDRVQMRQHGGGTIAAAHQVATVAVVSFLAHLVIALPLPPRAPSGCCVSYSLAYDHRECCHQFRLVSGPNECATEDGWVGGGKRFHARTTCEEAQRQVESSMSRQYETSVALHDEHIDKQGILHPTEGHDGGRDHSPDAVAESRVPFVGGSQSLGPVWTRDDSIEPPAGQRDMGGWNEAVYTSEQQARLGVDENGVENPSDTDGQQADEAIQAAEADLSPVINVLGPEEAKAGDRPCRTLPKTSMAVVQWNPQCDENGMFAPLQCDRDGNCWCADADGEKIEANLIEISSLGKKQSEQICFAARVVARSVV